MPHRKEAIDIIDIRPGDFITRTTLHPFDNFHQHYPLLVLSVDLIAIPRGIVGLDYNFTITFLLRNGTIHGLKYITFRGHKEPRHKFTNILKRTC